MLSTRPNFANRFVLGAACLLLVATGSAGESADSSSDTPDDSWKRRVERAAIAAAEGRVAPPDRFEVLSVRFAGADPVDSSESTIEPVEVRGPNESGVVNVTLRISEDGLPRATVRATVRGRVRGPALRAAKTLRAGKVIGPGDIEVADGDLTRLREAPLRRQADVLGLVPVRTLGSGRFITPRLLAPAPVVRRGQTADLSVRNPTLVVTTAALVLQDGAPGEVVPVQTVSSGTRLRARVLPDGSLLVER